MDKSAAQAFLFAKASGLLSKSFVQKRANLLFEAKSLEELWSLLFKTEPPSLPEVMLASQIEREYFAKFVNDYKYFIKQFEGEKQLLSEQLCVYEVENLKEVTEALCNGETECPHLIDLSGVTKLHFEKWPDLKAITFGTKYEWYNKIPDVHEQQKNEFKLDCQAWRQIWNAIEKTHGETKNALLLLYTMEFTFKNIIWALRLKINYQMSSEEIAKNLFTVKKDSLKDDPVASEALKVLEFKTDDWENWREWKYSKFINPNEPGNIWNISPSWLELKFRIQLNKTAYKIFHQYPMTDAALIAWYKLKSYEMTCVRSAVETLRLKLNSQESKQTLGIQDNS